MQGTVYPAGEHVVVVWVTQRFCDTAAWPPRLPWHKEGKAGNYETWENANWNQLALFR